MILNFEEQEPHPPISRCSELMTVESRIYNKNSFGMISKQKIFHVCGMLDQFYH